MSEFITTWFVSAGDLSVTIPTIALPATLRPFLFYNPNNPSYSTYESMIAYLEGGNVTESFIRNYIPTSLYNIFKNVLIQAYNNERTIEYNFIKSNNTFNIKLIPEDLYI